MQETWVRLLDREDSLEKEMATHSGILAWKISRTEEPGGLQSLGYKGSDTTERLTHYHASKFMLKILHARLQHYRTKNFQMSKLGLEKEEELEIKFLASIRCIIEIAREFQENICFHQLH